MATVRERSPGVWEVRVFIGRDSRGKPVQVSRTVRGTKRAAQKVAASLTVEPPAPEGNRTVAEALDEWLEVSGPTWAVSTLRDQTSRVSLVKRDVMVVLPAPVWRRRGSRAPPVPAAPGRRPAPPAARRAARWWCPQGAGPGKAGEREEAAVVLIGPGRLTRLFLRHGHGGEMCGELLRA